MITPTLDRNGPRIMFDPLMTRSRSLTFEINGMKKFRRLFRSAPSSSVTFGNYGYDASEQGFAMATRAQAAPTSPRARHNHRRAKLQIRKSSVRQEVPLYKARPDYMVVSERLTGDLPDSYGVAVTHIFAADNLYRFGILMMFQKANRFDSRVATCSSIKPPNVSKERYPFGMILAVGNADFVKIIAHLSLHLPLRGPCNGHSTHLYRCGLMLPDRILNTPCFLGHL
jgi:hypothetical protein